MVPNIRVNALMLRRGFKRPIIHIQNVREPELEKIRLLDEFDILQIAGEGFFGKILLVEHRSTQTEMILKALPKPYVSIQDFYREFHYSLCLGQHKNVVTTYDISFETSNFYLFAQEYATFGDLTSNLTDVGIGEVNTKKVAKQIANALEFIHLNGLVHRDVKLDNILVFKSNFSKVKLCDFGETRPVGSTVLRRNEWLPYSPPEVMCTQVDNSYRTDISQDIWQFAIVLFICLTGCLPWQKASVEDPGYNRYVQWQSSTFHLNRQPKLFKLMTPKACKMFKKILEPQFAKRVRTLKDVYKYLNDKWLAKNAEKELMASSQDRFCPSMFSFHSSKEEKNKLLNLLAKHGIETTVDRIAKKKRIKDWIHTSTISEEVETADGEVEEDSLTTPSSFVPVKTKSYLAEHRRKYIDPRTGMVVNPQENLEYQNCDGSFFIHDSPKKSCCKHQKYRVYKEEKKLKETISHPQATTRKSIRKCTIVKCSKDKPQIKAQPGLKKSSISESILKVKERNGKKSHHNRRVNIITAPDSPIFTKQIIVSSRVIPNFKFEESDVDDLGECTCNCGKITNEINDFDSDSIHASSNNDPKINHMKKSINDATPYNINHVKVYKKYNH